MKELEEKLVEEATIKLEFFCVKTDKPEEFIDKLEQLCKEYCQQEGFFFKYSIEVE